MTGLARFVHARARRILVAAGVFFVVAAVFGGPVAGELGREDRDFEDPQAESVRAEAGGAAGTGTVGTSFFASPFGLMP